MRTSLLRAACLLFALGPGLLTSLPAHAGTLKATITGKSGQPKPYVRVELIGPETHTLFTSQEGQLTAELPKGSYVLRVTERNRRMEFNVKVPAQGQLNPTFELAW
jgi:hypothetical protein